MRRALHAISVLRSQFERRWTFISNVSWVTLETIFQGVASLVAAVVIARFLGPDALGFWTYALATFSLATIAAALGTDQIVVLDIVKDKQRARCVIATAFAMRFGASMVLAAAMLGLAFAQPAEKSDLASLLAVMALAVPSVSLGVARLWFRSQSQFDVPAIANIVTTVVGTAAKILLVLATGSLAYVGLAHTTQAIALQIALFLLFVAHSGKTAFADFDGTYAKSLLRAGLPLLIADLAILVYGRANIFLLDSLRDAAEVGLFSAVARISEAIYMLPMVIGAVASPGMYRLYYGDRQQFLRRFDQMLSVMTVAALIPCAFIALFADRVTTVIFGASFSQSGPVLAIHVWTAVFVTQGIVSSIWLLAEKATTVLLMRTLIGAMINIFVGLLLIPRFGAVGAAVATLLAMAFASTVLLLFAGPLGREILVHQLRSLVLMPLWSRNILR